jgi:antitoxin protein of toxin-antitoxin system
VLRADPAGSMVGRMGFSDFTNKAKELADQHDEQVDQGLDRAGDMAKDRFAGHEGQIDAGVDRAQQYTGAGDTTNAGTEPGAEVPANPDDVPAGPGEVPPQQ